MGLDNDILIQIETAYKSGDMDAFRRSLDDAKKKVNDLSAAHENLGNKSGRTNAELDKGQKALSGLNAAASASRGSFQGFSQVLEVFGGKLATAAAKFSVLAGAFAAGSAVGTQLDKWLGISQKIADLYAGPMQKSVSIQDQFRASVEALAKADLSRLADQFAKVATAASEAERATTAMYAAKLRLSGERGELEIAQLERDIEPGPARDKAILEARRRQTLDQIEIRRQQQRDKLATAEQAVAAGRSEVERTESAEGDVRKSLMLLQRADSGATTAQRAEARLRLEAAEQSSAAARARLAPFEETLGQTRFEVSNEMRALEIQQQTANARFGAGMAPILGAERTAAANRSLVAGRLQSEIAGESALANQSGAPSGLSIAAGENAAALTKLLRSVQEGNEEVTNELIQLFKDQANNQDELRAAIQTLRDKQKNLPL